MSILDLTQRQSRDANSKNQGYGLIGAAALIYTGVAVSTAYLEPRSRSYGELSNLADF